MAKKNKGNWGEEFKYMSYEERARAGHPAYLPGGAKGGAPRSSGTNDRLKTSFSLAIGKARKARASGDVQGQIDASHEAASIARALGDHDHADSLEKAAERLATAKKSENVSANPDMESIIRGKMKAMAKKKSNVPKSLQNRNALAKRLTGMSLVELQRKTGVDASTIEGVHKAAAKHAMTTGKPSGPIGPGLAASQSVPRGPGKKPTPKRPNVNVIGMDSDFAKEKSRRNSLQSRATMEAKTQAKSAQAAPGVVGMDSQKSKEKHIRNKLQSRAAMQAKAEIQASKNTTQKRAIAARKGARTDGRNFIDPKDVGRSTQKKSVSQIAAESANKELTKDGVGKKAQPHRVISVSGDSTGPTHRTIGHPDNPGSWRKQKRDPRTGRWIDMPGIGKGR